MKKNTIFLIVDSVFYDKILGSENRNCPMPFFMQLGEKGLTTTKMYSEAPFTEAALVSLLGGTDTLKYGGYMRRLGDKKTIMEVFKENAYRTFFNGYQPHIHPKGAYPAFTDKFYNICFDLSAVWDYRLSYYSDLFKKGELEEDYFPLLHDDNFESWIECFEKVINKDQEMNLVIDIIDAEDMPKELIKVKNEYKKYLKNKDNYLKEFLSLGTEHALFKIKTYRLKRRTSIEFRKRLYEKEIKTFKKIYYLNAKKNLLNNRMVIKNPLKNKVESLQYLKMYKAAVFDKDLFTKIDYNNPLVKASPSMYTHLNHFLNWCDEYNDTNPFFAYIHVEECHYPEIFYSHDTNDEKRLDFEFQAIKEFINNLPKKYKGNLAYDLSLLYTDNCIKYLFEKLEEKGLLDKTNIAICADHGSSYTFDPMHDSYVRNEYRENYIIPFVLIGKDIKPKVVTNYCNSKDIPATILDACNIKIPKEYDGKSLFKYNGNNYVILQNINGGCPDYNKREVYIGVKNDNYSVTMMFDMNKEFKDGKIKSIFDMKKDKCEHKNMKSVPNVQNVVEAEMQIIKNVFNELKKDIKKNNFLYIGVKNDKN